MEKNQSDLTPTDQSPQPIAMLAKPLNLTIHENIPAALPTTTSQQQIAILAKRLNMTSQDEEPPLPYILTEVEQQELIEYSISRAKQWYLDSHLQKGERLGSIEFKIAQINWEEAIEKDDILKRGNASKHHEIWVTQQREAEKSYESNRQKELEKKYTAKFMFSLMRNTAQNVYGKDFQIHEHNQHLITAICYFLSKDIRFQTELGYSFKKGLWVRGTSGLGKTFLFKCVKDNELNPITIHSMDDISESVQEHGLKELPATKGLIYLDDVGSQESYVKHYGTNINFFKSFIEKYYLKNNDFNRLIVSTNNTFDEIQDKYTFRVRSRIKDMFNIINLKGTDMRGGGQNE